MKIFKLCFFSESYIKSGKVDDFGKIHIEIGDYAFPDKEWTDFGRIIVFWWLDAFIKLLSGERKKVECKFMDGSYRFDVETTNSPQVWRISLIREWADSEETCEQSEIDVKQATDEFLPIVTQIKDWDANAGRMKYVENIESFMKKFFILRQKALINAGH